MRRASRAMTPGPASLVEIVERTDERASDVSEILVPVNKRHFLDRSLKRQCCEA